MREWRLLCDPTGAEAIMDPTGAEYSFVLVDAFGQIVKREPSRSGFGHEAKEDLKRLLTKQLEALEKPFIREITETKIVGL